MLPRLSAKHTGKYQKILKYPRFDDDLAAALEDQVLSHRTECSAGNANIPELRTCRCPQSDEDKSKISKKIKSPCGTGTSCAPRCPALLFPGISAAESGFGDVQRERFRAPGSLPVTPGSLPVTGARVAHLVQYLADQSRELGLERVRTLTLPLSQDQS
jgi:hypothetical protein